MSVMKFSAKPAAAASSANADYITRLSATHSISFHNLEELECGNLQENRYSAIAYAEERQDQEKDMPGVRNHYRLILSFDRDVPTGDARELAHRYLTQEFPKTRAIVAIHQHDKPKDDREKIRDYSHTHAHVWIDARQVDGLKIQIKTGKFKTLDERWQQMYDQQYSTAYEKEFGESKWQTAEWRRQYAHAKENGLTLPDKPERIADRFHTKDYREKDLRDAGVNFYDQERSDAGQRTTTSEVEQIDDIARTIDDSQQAVERSQRSINDGKSAIERAVALVESAVDSYKIAVYEINFGRSREFEKLRDEASRLVERSQSIEISYDLDLQQ